MNIATAFANWKELSAGIPQDDTAALAESWKGYTDALCKDGELCALQLHYCPAFNAAMPGNGARFDDMSDDRGMILDALGVSMVATFVPFSASRNKGESDPSLNWAITIKRGAREVITTDYMRGSGHCPAYNNPSVFPGESKKPDRYTTKLRIAEECETGREARASALGHIPGAKISPPDLQDVMHCLLLDSSAIDCGGFADWCNEYGDDSDSIKARATYDACLDAALKLRAAFGGKTMSELHELFEGM